MHDYSLDQVEMFLAAIDVEEKGRARVALITARAAQADKKGFQQMMKEFS
ncbi:hypothetical protein [Stutzerimonas nosocomialis]|nr:hypothetical protein [Stutzerimonas nosocomialis]